MSKLNIPTLEEAFQPFFAYTKFATEAAEKALKIQFDSARTYSKIGMENFAAGLKVTNLDQFTKYAENQKAVAKETNEQFMTDAKAYSEIGAKFFENSKTLAQDTAESTFEAANKAAQAVTKAATKAGK